MKTVLYIDTFSQFGHNNLNKVYLNQFRESDCKVSVIARSNYIREIEVPDEEVVFLIPESYYIKDVGKIEDRIIQWKILLLIKRNVNFSDYDIVFFSYFDEIPFTLAGLEGNLFFMNHSNVSGLENLIKRFFLNRISKIGNIVVFHKSISDQFAKYGILNTITEPLGLSSPFSKLINFDLLGRIDNRLTSSEFELKIFIPTISKYSDDFIQKILLDKDFLKFLCQKKILLVIKDRIIQTHHQNIIILNNFLAEEEYQMVFKISDVILLHYPNSFKFKISASLFECFSNNKACLVSEIDSFKLFKSKFIYNPYYNSQDQLIELIENCFNPEKINLTKPFRNLDDLNPTLKSVLNFPLE